MQNLGVVGLLGEHCNWEDKDEADMPSAKLVRELAVYRQDVLYVGSVVLRRPWVAHMSAADEYLLLPNRRTLRVNPSARRRSVPYSKQICSVPVKRA